MYNADKQRDVEYEIFAVQVANNIKYKFALISGRKGDCITLTNFKIQY